MIKKIGKLPADAFPAESLSILPLWGRRYLDNSYLYIFQMFKLFDHTLTIKELSKRYRPFQIIECFKYLLLHHSPNYHFFQLNYCGNIYLTQAQG